MVGLLPVTSRSELSTYTNPRGKMEEFFREVGGYHGETQVHEALSSDQLGRLLHDHGMDLLGAPLVGEWSVDEDGRIVRTA